nr:MAG TPA: hypothetical protein [Caudoviricetes sp.]
MGRKNCLICMFILRFLNKFLYLIGLFFVKKY